jgi:hypothetical protein
MEISSWIFGLIHQDCGELLPNFSRRPNAGELWVAFPSFHFLFSIFHFPVSL